MCDKIVILGGRGTAVVVAEQIHDAYSRFGLRVEFLGFAFDDPLLKDSINGWPVLCGTREVWRKFEKQKDVKFIYLMYRSDIIEERVALRDSFGIPKERFYTFIHPSSYIAKSVKMGYGNVILANCCINSNVVMGNFNSLMFNSLVGHDTRMGDNNFIAAATVIGSNIKIGNGNFTGLNSSIKNMVTMGNYNLVGMAANVVKPVTDHEILIGNPAKRIIKNK